MKLFAKKKGRLARKKKGDDDDSKSNNTSAGWHRMQTDMASLELPDNVTLDVPDKQDLMNFFVTVTPEDGYWKTGTFKFKFTVPPDYPYTPPKITCLDKVCWFVWYFDGLFGICSLGSLADNAAVFLLVVVVVSVACWSWCCWS